MLGEKEIWLSGSGRHVKIGQLGALEARHTARLLANAIGRGLRGAAKPGAGTDAKSRATTAKDLLEQDVDVLGALGTMLEELDDATLDALTNTFTKKTKVETDDGKWTPLSSVVDVVFGGGEGLADWFEWLSAAVEFSCGPFFGRLLGLKERVASLKSAPSVVPESPPSPTESTGSFTGSPRVKRIEVSR